MGPAPHKWSQTRPNNSFIQGSEWDRIYILHTKLNQLTKIQCMWLSNAHTHILLKSFCSLQCVCCTTICMVYYNNYYGVFYSSDGGTWPQWLGHVNLLKGQWMEIDFQRDPSVPKICFLWTVTYKRLKGPTHNTSFDILSVAWCVCIWCWVRVMSPTFLIKIWKGKMCIKCEPFLND